MKQGTTELLKFLALQKTLGDSKRGTVGLLELLWSGTAKNAPQGDIGRFTNAELALLVDWDGCPDQLVDALIKTGWLDCCQEHRLIVHDWADHCPTWVKGNLARHKREIVKATKQVAATDCAGRDTNSRNLLPSQAKPNQSKPSQTNPSQVNKPPAAPDPMPDGLIDAINSFNQLAESYELPKSKLPAGKKLQSLWKAAIKNENKKAALSDFSKIKAAIANSEFVQGNASFSLAGLLTNNRMGDSKLLKLINGDYQDAKSKRGRPIEQRAGKVSRYESNEWS